MTTCLAPAPANSQVTPCALGSDWFKLTDAYGWKVDGGIWAHDEGRAAAPPPAEPVAGADDANAGWVLAALRRVAEATAEPIAAWAVVAEAAALVLFAPDEQLHNATALTTTATNAIDLEINMAGTIRAK